MQSDPLAVTGLELSTTGGLIRMVVSIRTIYWSIATSASLLLGGCISPTLYIDASPESMPPAVMHKVAAPAPVQLLFDFQTRGVINSRATDYLKAHVKLVAEQTGDFSSVTLTPAPNGALLSLVINNIPQEDAAAKGFLTGLTFGAAGSTTTDFYVCTATYLAQPGVTPLVTEAKHKIYTTIGATDDPIGATRADNVDMAALAMVTQIVQHAIDNLAADPAFGR